MKVVAVIGATGGAGATTAVAQLTGALVAQRRAALAVDLCPENVLRLHFAMPWQDANGWATRLLAKRQWQEAGYRSESGVDFVPFGKLSDEGELDRLTAWLEPHPTWFAERLRELAIAPEAIVLCDCPRAPAPLRAQALSAADLVLLVCSPDVVSYAATVQMAESAAVAGAPAVAILLNGFDPARTLDRDVSVLLRTTFHRILVPLPMHRDEALREALACKQPVADYAPTSHAAYEFNAIATWLVAHLSHLRRNA